VDPMTLPEVSMRAEYLEMQVPNPGRPTLEVVTPGSRHVCKNAAPIIYRRSSEGNRTACNEGVNVVCSRGLKTIRSKVILRHYGPGTP